MKFTDYFPIVSILISLIALMYTYKSNTKKYELSSSIRKDILEWYSKTVEILITLRSLSSTKNVSIETKRPLLAKLSALIEVGRFYFPNIDKSDGFGATKYSAYKGYRNSALDFLVYSYQLFDSKDAHRLVRHALVLQRQFTSDVFDVLDPRGFLNETKKYTNKSFSKDVSYEDFINHEPEYFDIDENE